MRLWDSTDSSAPMNSYRAPNDGAVTVVRFTPGGEWLLIGHASGTVALWGLTDAARAIAPAPVKLHDAAIACIAFHPSDALVATADIAGTVRLFELRPSDGSLTAIGSPIDCQCSPIKALCFVGSSTLVAAADGHVVSLQIVESPPHASLSVSNRIAAPALTGVHEMIADVDASHVIVSSQTQRPGGVCVWRVHLDGASPQTPTQQKSAAVTPASNENVPTNNAPQVVPVATPPAPTTTTTTKKVASARNHKKTAAAAVARTSSTRTPPAVPVVIAQKAATPVLAAAAAPAPAAAAPAQPVSEERRVLDELLQGHKQTRATIEARSRKFDSARLVLQQSGSRLSDALKAVHGGSGDIGHAVSTAEQMAKRAQECADKFEYGPALALADGAMALIGEVLSSWNLDEWQVCTALSLVAQLAKWCDVSAGSEHDAMASSCRSRFSAVMRVLRCENALPFQLTARTRELRHECLKFEKYY